VRNADSWPVAPQIGHSALKRLDIIQTEFNVITEQGVSHRRIECEKLRLSGRRYSNCDVSLLALAAG